MKKYFQIVLFFAVLSFMIADAIRIHELGEQAFGFYMDGAFDVAILLLAMYCVDKPL